ncbi:MAG: hypothetical protein COV66_06880 [Nitrospinae bacterium CG11_big_fil_rev_8_21_14_0_20_45_15]|nr:MAG: hypothetical protein COV66_06880 [Nitrospinae bacterium CG11_big_fil_rev_8_21_14_0_20_45_15]
MMPLEKIIDTFWANGKDLKEEYKYHAAVTQLLADIRAVLDNSSPTAQAIDNKESWESIAQKAREEGLNDFASILSD